MAALGILVLALLAALFVPVRYRLNGNYAQGAPELSAGFSWLLHILSGRLTYGSENDIHIAVKLFGITLFDNLRPSKHKSIKDKDVSEKSDSSVGTTDFSSHEPEYISMAEKADASEEDDISKKADASEKADINEKPDFLNESDLSDEQSEQDKKQKNSFLEKINEIFCKIKQLIQNLKYTFGNICDTIRNVCDNIKYYMGIIRMESTKRAFDKCKRQLSYVFRRLKPRVCRVNMQIGFKDPSVTGQIMALWGMAYPVHNGSIQIYPDFDYDLENPLISGDLFIKGRINLFTFVKVLLVLIFDKDIKVFIRCIKKEQPKAA